MPDGRMTPEQFGAKYGRVLAMSLWGARWVGSALTKSSYIYFDHKSGQYITEKR
jgi:hypothetical protein